MAQREEIIQRWLGRPAHVVIDRPAGYVHHGLRYPLNYGYLPGVMAPDGEEQDVYVLGVTEPLQTFDGRIIAAVRRRDDAEDKLVAAPEGMCFHQAQIAQAIHFQERFLTALWTRWCGDPAASSPTAFAEAKGNTCCLCKSTAAGAFPRATWRWTKPSSKPPCGN